MGKVDGLSRTLSSVHNANQQLHFELSALDKWLPTALYDDYVVPLRHK